MRKFCLVQMALSLMLLITTPVHARQKAGQELAFLLQTMVEEREVHPDSLYPQLVRMKERVARTADPTERAIGQAVLGYLYGQSAHTAQARSYETESDSTHVQEWSRADYYMAAGRCFAEALEDMDLLHQARQKDWLPLLTKGKDDHYYNEDMLCVVWRAARQTMSSAPWTDELRALRPSAASVVDYYKKNGCREAAFLLVLDSLSGQALPAAFKQEWGDLGLYPEAYIHEYRYNYGLTVAQRDSLLSEAFERYPRYPHKATLQNMRAQMQEPILTARRWHSTYLFYPGVQNGCSMELTVRNVRQAKVSVYRLNADRSQWNIDEQETDRELLKRVRQQGRLVTSFVHPLAQHKPYEEWVDTLHWTTDDCGDYLMVLEPVTDAKLARKPGIFTLEYHVSRLLAMQAMLPGGRQRIIVADGQTGAPAEGVDVKLCTLDESPDSDPLVQINLRTDSRGVVEFDANREGMWLMLEKGDDKYYPWADYRNGRFNLYESEAEQENIRLYTDRLLYRPGQTVHVGGVASETHKKLEQVTSGRTIVLQLMDANYQEVGRQTVKTDEYGVFSTEFVLPKNCMPGYFRIKEENNWRVQKSIRVEEYKRPTFDVAVDEVPAIQLPADSIVLTGRATFFSGTPVRNARVVADCDWDRSIWWSRYEADDEWSYEHTNDTIYTDNDGRFRLVVPLGDLTEKQWNNGVRLTVAYSVLSAAGETQTAQQNVQFSSVPLRISADIPRQNDKGNLQPWTFTLYSSTGKEMEGQVKLDLRSKQGTSVYTTDVRNGSQVIRSLSSVPSGSYDLYIKGIAGKDTASVVKPVVLFGLDDQCLPLDTLFWVYPARREFAPGSPARIQVGSSRRDVSLYCLMMSKSEVVHDTIFQFSDSLFVMDIPYEERFGDGLTVNIFLVKEGKFCAENLFVNLTRPEKTLQHKWIVFRDKLQPGQQETWQLQLTNPDGTPARANLMAAMYDASLDAIQMHHWSTLGTAWRQGNPYTRVSTLMYSSIKNDRPESDFAIRQQRQASFRFSELNPMLFGDSRTEVHAPRLAYAAAPMVLKEVAVRTEASVMTKYAIVTEGNMALEGRIAGLDIDDSEEEGRAVESPTAPLRENFNETAFFYPSLRTDEEGVVTISFTLPESMTRWRMLNLAHTKDLNTALWDETVVAQKELMAQLVLPRFLRQGDEACLTASVTNISDQAQKGRAQMFIMDAETEKVVGKKSFDLSLATKSDTVFTLPYTASVKSSALIVRVVADGGQCQDGEQRLLPILPCTEHVLNTMDISLTRPGTYTYDLSTLLPKEAADVHYSFDYTSRPVWMAIRALPSLARPCCDDVLSLASAYYARTLGSYVAQHMVGLDAMIAEWQKADSKQAVSPLEQNQEVKNLLLNETPWVLEARNETQRQQHLADLFCEDVLLGGRLLYINKVEALQRTDGSFSWFPGLPGSYYMTCRVAYQLARLQTLTNGDDEAYRKANQVLMKALGYLKAQNQKSRSGYDMAYLYVLYTTKESTTRQERKVASAMLDRLEKDMENLNVENLAEAIIVLQKAGREKSARKFMDRLEHFLVTTDKEGTYIEHPQGSRTSIDRKIAIHTKIMEAETIVGSSDKLSGLRRYLLRQKRTEGWDNPGNTADAVYALLLGDTLLLAEQAEDKVVLNGSRLTINKRTKGESWGAAFVQCQAPLKDVEAASAGLMIRQEIVSEPRKIGDRLVVRYVVTADRDYEYVVLRGSRPACLEPVTQLSGYRWQNGLGYYRAMHDASTDYCFDRLPRGTYVLEEEFNVSQLGNYQTGLSTLQCQYAPEFQGRTSSRSVMVK